jgi:integrase
MAACDRYRGNKARVKAFVLVMRYSGLRIGDTVTLRRDRLKDSKLLLYTAKTGTPVYIPLPPVVVEALNAIAPFVRHESSLKGRRAGPASVPRGAVPSLTAGTVAPAVAHAYSVRRAAIGSTRSTRRTGTRHASMHTPNINTV